MHHYSTDIKHQLIIFALFQQSSVFKAIDYWKKAATPPGLDWVPNLIALVKRYFIGDPRPHVNMKTLDVLKDIYTKHA